MSNKKGSFTLPGESGYEELTLRMAEKWGADVIRDSDGTQLSQEILDAGYGIYSTICIIREHNAWLKDHPECRQQTFLITPPEAAVDTQLSIPLLKSFFNEQFEINSRISSLKYWQVYDRTTETLLPNTAWKYNQETASVTVFQAVPFHEYTVSFLAYRIWEEISMYNHVTNNWHKEHLMPVDPRLKEARDYLYNWLENWCKTHPATTVVRFTSLFYNFVWIWGASERNRNIFTDWASYDFTVSEKALEDFEKEYGYALSAEDFVNKGNFQVTHMPPSEHKRDYMEFTQKFVADFGKELVALVHKYGKQAYVFYDDSWVGLEPYGEHFAEIGFDGIIKCIFSGYEVRLCNGVAAPVHELRFHPYLFPVGLGGLPTFSKGGKPADDARDYWIHARRAMLRAKIDRIGLGGYLHLVEDFPEFTDYIEKIADEFRTIKELHEAGKPYTLPCRIAVLHCWGKLRSWTLSGHFHETYMHDLIHVNESLSGMPFDVDYISFEDVKNGALSNYSVVINAGKAGTAWSGGDAWQDSDVVTAVNEWVHNGGVFLGIHEPSACGGHGTFFRLAGVLGIDKDTGAKVCHGKYSFAVQTESGLIPENASIKKEEGIFLTDGSASVLAADGNSPLLTVHNYGKGKGVYMSHYAYSIENTRMLMNIILYAAGLTKDALYTTDNPAVECTWFPAKKTLAVINNSASEQKCTIKTEEGERNFTLKPYETIMS